MKQTDSPPGSPARPATPNPIAVAALRAAAIFLSQPSLPHFHQRHPQLLVLDEQFTNPLLQGLKPALPLVLQIFHLVLGSRAGRNRSPRTLRWRDGVVLRERISRRRSQLDLPCKSCSGRVMAFHKDASGRTGLFAAHLALDCDDYGTSVRVPNHEFRFQHYSSEYEGKRRASHPAK